MKHTSILFCSCYYQVLVRMKLIHIQDAVGVSLYKRVWPREARAWREDEARAHDEDAIVQQV